MEGHLPWTMMATTESPEATNYLIFSEELDLTFVDLGRTPKEVLRFEFELGNVSFATIIITILFNYLRFLF